MWLFHGSDAFNQKTRRQGKKRKQPLKPRVTAVNTPRLKLPLSK